MKSIRPNRRQFLAGLAASCSPAALFTPALSYGQVDKSLPSSPVVKTGSSSRHDRGNTYDRLGYKRLILDYHYSDFNPRALENANAREIVQAVSKLGVESLVLYSKDHWGNVYSKSSFSKRHPNVPEDLFGEVLNGVKQHGIHVVAYTTVCWDEDSSRKHPDWVMRDASNHPIRMDDGALYAKWTFLCLNSPYREYFLRQMDELIGNYDFEALFLDILIQHRDLVCYNPYCLAKWKDRYGTDLPRELSDSDYARYLDFNRDTEDSLFEEIRNIGLGHRKQFWMTHNFGLTYKYDDYLVSESDTFGADFFLPSMRAKIFRARARGKEVELIGHRFNRFWDFTLKPLPLMQFEVATAIAHNCAMSFVDQPYLDGSLDPQVYDALKLAFAAADDLAPRIKGTVPYAEVGLLSCERSFEFDYSTYSDFSGAYAMLSQLHWPYDVIIEDDLTDERLKHLKLLIVPNTVHLSRAQAGAIRRYVERGGSLVFCYRSATKDENAGLLDQPSFGLLQSLQESDNQVSFVRPRWNAVNRYLRVSTIAVTKALASCEVEATITDPALRVTDSEWISHNVMPGQDTEAPAILSGTLGSGKFAYFAFRIFDEYVKQGQPALRDAFEHMARSLYHPTVWVETTGDVETVMSQTESGLQIVLINGITSKVMTGDMWGGEKAIRGPITIAEVVPIQGIDLKVEGQKVVRAHDMAGNDLKISRDGTATTVTLPLLKQYGLIDLRIES